MRLRDRARAAVTVRQRAQPPRAAPATSAAAGRASTSNAHHDEADARQLGGDPRVDDRETGGSRLNPLAPTPRARLRRARRRVEPGDLPAARDVGDRRADDDRVLVGDRAVVVVADRQRRVQPARRRRRRRGRRRPGTSRRGGARRRAPSTGSCSRQRATGWKTNASTNGPPSASSHEFSTSRPAHRARRPRARRALVGLGRHVRVAAPAARRGRQRHRERRQLVARLQPLRALPSR